MEILIKYKNGLTLHTQNKYCREDVKIGIETEKLNITPSTETQKFDGLYGEVTVQGEENLEPENIKEGVSIFGKLGTHKSLDTSDATATIDDLVEGTTAYVNGQKIEGTMPNNGTLSFTPTDNRQVIPSGYTEGGYIEPANIETLQDYNTYLSIADEILGEEV